VSDNLYTISDSIRNSYITNGCIDLKADIFLTIYLKNQNSMEYSKLQKKISKLSKKAQKLATKNKHKYAGKLEQYENEIEEAIYRKNELIELTKNNPLIHDHDLISKRLIQLYRKGLVIGDLINKVYKVESSYGRLIYYIFKSLSNESIVKIIKRKFGNLKPSYLSQIQSSNPKLKDKEYLDTEEGALLLESHFIIFLVTLATEDYTEDQLKELLDTIAIEIAGDNKLLYDEIKNIYRAGAVTHRFGKILLQIVRLSVGKGLFMNSLVKVTNVALRVVAKKGMTFAQNAIFRKYVARFLGSGPWAIALNIALFIPDIATLVNKRDYFGVTKSLMLLYFIRNSNDMAHT